MEPFTSPCPNKTLPKDKDLPLTSLGAPEAVTWGLTRVPLTLQRADLLSPATRPSLLLPTWPPKDTKSGV